MSSSIFPYVFLFLGFSVASILLGLSIFAFGAPKLFARWTSPFFWLTRRFFRNRPDRWDYRMAYISGTLFLSLLIALQFILGGFVATLFFRLWYSPFAFLLIR